MKRILILLLAVVAMILPSAAKTIEFMGIPVEGTITEFTKKLQAKEFTIDPDKNEQSDGSFFIGNIDGVPCRLIVCYGLESKLVYEVTAIVDIEVTNDDEGMEVLKKMAEFFEASYKDGVASSDTSNKFNPIFTYDFYDDDSDIAGYALLAMAPKYDTKNDIYLEMQIKAFNSVVLRNLSFEDLSPLILETIDTTQIEILSEDQVKNEVMDAEMAEDYRAIGVNSAGDDDFDKLKSVHEQVVVTEPEPELRRYMPEKIFVAVEQPAEFPGGQAAMMKWISEHRQYPEAAKANGISGRVVVKFVVEKDGSISGVQIVKGVDRDLDQEALRLIKSMPNWYPGKNNGEPVRSYFNLPVTFRLPD